ncbi:GNAT family N-acetyltransferase [Leifsonia sp. H3M29-4]|uniref:GNAT family N-acetyltransferase n=1 Tax=Salinibacterium metalliresistens TaxID=3031321 RepID=UPI0023DC48C5|nr:GNAT family N-acetyltransferase [Salinibacterium metalliresistens]MDF1477877.1 GNAT family N-acetyltransferase [Salinibacterium metalliresistens]
MPTEVVQDAAMNRFELLVDGTQVGLVDYQLRGDSIVFTHTEIDPARRGEGLGSELARGALNLVRAETDYRLVASCPFIAAWIEKNPSYADLLTR